jgi:(+)-trans-carveol dehydrogenase
MGRLDGKVAMVTGAGRGLGRAFCSRLAEEGSDVICLDLAAPIDSVEYELAGSADLDETVSLVEAMGQTAIAVVADVRDQTQLDAAVATGIERFGAIDVVCPNAGILSHGLAWDLTEDQWTAMVDIALSGAWRTAKAAIPAMIAAGNGGSIIFTSSAVGLKPASGLAHYVAAKHGVVGLARALALELGEHGIRVNTVNPTVVDTPMVFNEPTYRAFVPDKDEPTRADVTEVYANLNALPVAVIDPVDVANAVVWLASEEARYVTGVALPVDAGNLQK